MMQMSAGLKVQVCQSLFTAKLECDDQSAEEGYASSSTLKSKSHVSKRLRLRCVRQSSG